MFGSAVYFLAVYLPSSRLEYKAKRALTTAAKILNPTRELRDARAAFEYTPTAQNQMRLAAALVDSGAAEEAAAHYEACLKGPFANDLDIRLAAARAYFQAGQPLQTILHLQAIRRANTSPLPVGFSSHESGTGPDSFPVKQALTCLIRGEPSLARGNPEQVPPGLIQKFHSGLTTAPVNRQY